MTAEEAVLRARAFHYVMDAYGLKRIEPRPYREIFRADAASLEAYLASRAETVEEYGAHHHLSIVERDGRWLVCFYEYDERSGPNTSQQEFATLAAARRGMIDWMLRDQYFRLDHHFSPAPCSKPAPFFALLRRWLKNFSLSWRS